MNSKSLPHTLRRVRVEASLHRAVPLDYLDMGAEKGRGAPYSARAEPKW